MNNDTIISNDNMPKRAVTLLNQAGIRTVGHLKASITIDPDWLSRIPGMGPTYLLAIKNFISSVRGGQIEDFADLPKRLREALHYLSIGSPEELSIFLAENGAARLLREPNIGRAMWRVAIEFAEFHDLLPVSSKQRISNIVARWQASVLNDNDAMKEVETVSRFFNLDH